MMFGNPPEKNESGKGGKKGGASVDSVASVRLMAEMEQAKKDVEEGLRPGFVRGDPGCGTVISGRRAGGGTLCQGGPEQ